MNGIDMRRIRVAEDWTLTVVGLVLAALLLAGVLRPHPRRSWTYLRDLPEMEGDKSKIGGSGGGYQVLGVRAGGEEGG